MLRFDSDYVEGCHINVMTALTATNNFQTGGYGVDDYSDKAKATIRELCELPEAAVHFAVGGTQANVTVISHLLRPYEGVIAVESGHINEHETGAVEATGHKVLTLPSTDGKVKPDAVKRLVLKQRNSPSFEHEVRPGMVYISQTTEVGTVYTQAELDELHAVCQELGLPLYIDGARLGYALGADLGEEVQQTFASIARSCEVFTIGGTKCGTLFGEAIVFTQPELGKDFRYTLKQRGGMLAKGRLLGIQFEALLKDGIYLRVTKYADTLAMQIKETLLELGLELTSDSVSNQQFVALPSNWLPFLSSRYTLDDMGPWDETRHHVRICTSWSTKSVAVDLLLQDLRNLSTQAELLNQQF